MSAPSLFVFRFTAIMPSTVFSALLAVVALFSAAWPSGIAPRIFVPAAGERPHVSVVTRRDSTPLYTEQQATDGAVLFGKVCVECHEKKDVTKADFRAKWTGRPIFDLYELVRTTMPDSNPGGLSRDEYANALAYILKLNGLPAGSTAVMPDSATMQRTMLELPAVPPL